VKDSNTYRSTIQRGSSRHGRSPGTRQGSPTLFREPPPSAAKQREKILALLRDAARSGRGVSGDTFRYDFDIRQAPTRIFELKNEFGYRIETVQDPETRLATYHFRGDPPEGWRPPAKQARLRLKAPSSSEVNPTPGEDTAESEYMRRVREEQAQAMPLFQAVRP